MNRRVVILLTLERLQRLEQPIRVGVIGSGAMGKGLLYQCSITPGMKCVALADKDIGKAMDAATSLILKYDTAESVSGMKSTIGRQELALCTDGIWSGLLVWLPGTQRTGVT